MAQLREMDFLKESVLVDPLKTYRSALAGDFIFKMPGQDVYGVFGSDLVDQVFKRVGDFSSDYGAMFSGRFADDPEIRELAEQSFPHISVLLTTDPPVHTHQRKLVNMAFSKPRVDAMAEEIRRIVTRLIDSFIDRGECEFVSDFAVPLPVEIIGSQYGLADEPKEAIKRWSNAILDRAGGTATRAREIECARDLMEFQRAMIKRIHARRETPHNDLLSDLVNAKIEGERSLNDDELMAILQQLVTAGNDTTSGALGMGLLMLIQNPDKLEIVRADRSKIPNMVEEMLRYDPPAAGTWRLTKEDVELGGVRIPANSMVMVRLAAANRDAKAFEQPDQFDPTRKNAHRHFSFGRGIHACIGNMLARREMAIAFEEILDRLDDIKLLDIDLVYHPNHLTRNLVALKIGFEARRQ